MPRLVMFEVPSDAGQDLLDNWVAPACRRHGVRFELAKGKGNRGTALAYQWTADFVLWDCSVEGPRRVYDALTTLTMIQPKNLLVSRTPLPRNVLSYHQFAPVHGESFSNDLIGEWLDRRLFAALGGGPGGDGQAGAPAWPRHAENYWLPDAPADYFLSFRGSHQAAAERWRDAFAAANGATVRMVPPNEYSYPTEVVTQQQQWEGVARLQYELQSAGRVIVLMTDDYFDSFWTGSELLLLLGLSGAEPVLRPFRPAKRPGWRPVTAAGFADLASGAALSPFGEGMRARSIPGLTSALADRLAVMVNNGDPMTAAPESQFPPSGPQRFLARMLRARTGHYLPEFITDDYWRTVRVPCPSCKPRHRAPGTMDWGAHMSLADSSPAVDYYGYFPATRAELESGRITCPRCRSRLRVVSERDARTVWVPILSTEPDQDRPVIREDKVWEVQ